MSRLISISTCDPLACICYNKQQFVFCVVIEFVAISNIEDTWRN